MLNNSFFVLGETPFESFCQLLYSSKVIFTGAFSWTPMGAELGKGTLNN